MTHDQNQTADDTRPSSATTRPIHETRGDVVDREREQHGGVKIGSAFFGWLTATGMAVLLSAIVAVTGRAGRRRHRHRHRLRGLRRRSTSSSTTSASSASSSALAILFVSYYSGGYVAGRMARFDGIKQGIAVWVWAIVVAVVIGVLAAVADDEYSGQRRAAQVSMGEPDHDGIVGVAVVALVSLVGAMLGGLAGMRFHRRVDRTGLGR